jgi:hypothetical protein
VVFLSRALMRRSRIVRSNHAQSNVSCQIGKTKVLATRFVASERNAKFELSSLTLLMAEVLVQMLMVCNRILTVTLTLAQSTASSQTGKQTVHAVFLVVVDYSSRFALSPFRLSMVASLVKPVWKERSHVQLSIVRLTASGMDGPDGRHALSSVAMEHRIGNARGSSSRSMVALLVKETRPKAAAATCVLARWTVSGVLGQSGLHVTQVAVPGKIFVPAVSKHFQHLEVRHLRDQQLRGKIATMVHALSSVRFPSGRRKVFALCLAAQVRRASFVPSLLRRSTAVPLAHRP